MATEMAEWQLAVADDRALGGDPAVGDAKPPAAIVVFARKDEEDHALAVCRRLRSEEKYRGVPLLVAVTIYQMPLGNDVKRLRNAHFIFTPIKEDDLRQRIASMTGA